MRTRCSGSTGRKLLSFVARRRARTISKPFATTTTTTTSIAGARSAAPKTPSSHRTGRVLSVGFSGAGFLGCYHVGVSACLRRHGVLPDEDDEDERDDVPVALLGASAGALVCAALALRVRTDDCMDIVHAVARETRRRGGALDALRPGYSLVDEVDRCLYPALRDACGDDDELARRRLSSSGLRVALSDRRAMARAVPGSLAGAYRYADDFRDLHDLSAAAVLSSYIPGVTGPIKGTSCPTNGAVRRAWERTRRTLDWGAVKHGDTGRPVTLDEIVVVDDDDNDNNREAFWDGGLSNMWPVLDDRTIVVSPLNGDFSPNPFVAPASPSDLTIPVSERTKVGFNLKNMDAAMRMCLSSEATTLDKVFANGYDDASRFLSDHSMERVFSV